MRKTGKTIRMKSILISILVLIGAGSLPAQFTRQEYFAEYVKVVTLDIKVVKLSASIFLSPDMGWDQKTRRTITPMVMVPAIGFTVTRTIEMSFCNLFKIAPKWFIKAYSARMRYERNIANLIMGRK
jgi:hypothetical protein